MGILDYFWLQYDTTALQIRLVGAVGTATLQGTG
jgi:hypothetical protein